MTQQVKKESDFAWASASSAAIVALLRSGFKAAVEVQEQVLAPRVKGNCTDLTRPALGLGQTCQMPFYLLIQRAAAIRRRNVRLDEVCCALIGVDLIFDSCKTVAFIFVDLVFGHPSALLDRIHYLQSF